jgi:hypothetical protein
MLMKIQHVIVMQTLNNTGYQPRFKTYERLTNLLKSVSDPIED